jgi:hypothetical protein
MTFAVHLACPEDIPDVIAGVSDGIYNGYDYLPNVISTWIGAHSSPGSQL